MYNIHLTFRTAKTEAKTIIFKTESILLKDPKIKKKEEENDQRPKTERKLRKN